VAGAVGIAVKFGFNRPGNFGHIVAQVAHRRRTRCAVQILLPVVVIQIDTFSPDNLGVVALEITKNQMAFGSLGHVF
jgi:hypothetical protein